MFNNALLMGAASAAASGAGGYTVDYSCRFDDSTPSYLTYTPGSAGDRRQITLSYWQKRCRIGLKQQVTFSNIGNTYFQFGNPSVTNAEFEMRTEGSGHFITSQIFRDPTAWFHIVLSFDTEQTISTDRMKMYVNGNLVSNYNTYTAITLNTDMEITNAIAQRWGIYGTSTALGADCYLSQVCMIDGLALAATDFGEFDDNNVWRPIDITGLTFGTTGYLLDFADSSALGNDVSGNDNDFASTGLSTDDQFPDTPTKNWCTFSSIATRASNLVNGNLKVVTDPNGSAASTMSVTSGKWYWEFTMVDGTSNERACYISQNNSKFMAANIHGDGAAATGTFVGYWSYNGNIIDYTSDYPGRAYGDTYADGDVISCALDLDNNAVWFAKNGTWQDSATEAEIEAGTTTNAAATSLPAGRWFFVYSGGDYKDCIGNFGQSSYAHSVPDGFLDVNTTNIAKPTILDGTANFQPTLYSGTGAVQTIGQQTNSYSNKYGSGDRTSIIASSGVGGAYNNASPVGILVNGVTTAASGPGIETFATDMNWKFVFMEAVNITEVLIDMQSAGGNLGDSWLWEGSNNDFSSTTALSGTIDISSNTDPEIQTLNLIGASDTYQYYRLRNTNGGGSNSTTWDEFNFKVAPLNADSTFQPDFVWIKNRSAADNHMLIDAARGVTKELNSDRTTVESTDANGLTAFTSSGFTLGTGAGGYNDDGESFVAWQWSAGGGAGSSNTDGSINTTTTTVNTTSGFSCSTFVGTGANATVGHGLGVAPKMIILKCRNDATGSGEGDWYTYHGANTTAPETDFLELNSTAATSDDAIWQDTAPTSSVFSISDSVKVNVVDNLYIVYCFAEIEGFSRFGTYIGATAGGLVYTGFKPAWVMIKKTSGTGNWVMYDSQRSPYNEVDDQLLANTTAAETTGSEEIDFLANGFKCRTTDSDINSNLGDYVFAAFAEYPFGGDGVTPSTAF